MGKKHILLPAFTLIAGAVGFALRKWQLRTGFEPDTGLAIPGAPSAIALLAFSAAVALALILLCWKGKERMDWRRAFAPARGSTLYMTAMVLGGFLLLGSAWLELMSLGQAYQAAAVAEGGVERIAAMVLPPLRVGLSGLGLPCVVLWGRALYRSADKGRENLGLLELCLLLCVCLIAAYQLRAADPLVMDYLYDVLSIVAALLGVYFLSGYSFQPVGKPRRTTVMCLLGAYLSLVTMADGHTLAELLRLAFAVLFLTAHAALLLGDHPAGEPGAEDTEAAEHA